MTYFKDATTGVADSPFEPMGKCMCCGEATTGPTVAYDLVTPDTGTLVRAFFHRDCAFAMAQRIICDAWPNRRDGEWMKNDR